MNEFEDLDQLEREFGAALRVALRRVAADIPDEASPWSPGPVARLRHLDSDHLDPDEQLTEVTVSANTPTDQTRKRRRLLIAAAAVLVVIGVAGIALAATAKNDDNDQSPAPVATVAVAPTAPVATETVSFAVKSANDIPVTFTKPKSWGILDELTAWPVDDPTTLEDPSRITAPDPNVEPPTPDPIGAYSRLTQNRAVVQFASVSNIYRDGCELDTHLDPPVGPTVDDLVTAWANIPELAPTAPVDITVDGYTGKRIELTVPDFDLVTCGNSGVFRYGLWYGAYPQRLSKQIFADNVVTTPNRHYEMLVLDVDGTRLLIAASTDPNTPHQDRVGLEGLLRSIQIG